MIRYPESRADADFPKMRLDVWFAVTSIHVSSACLANPECMCLSSISLWMSNRDADQGCAHSPPIQIWHALIAQVP